MLLMKKKNCKFLYKGDLFIYKCFNGKIELLF